MSKELIENLLEYADIAEAGEKSHWAKAMREAAEYIKADLEKPLPEPVSYQFQDSTGIWHDFVNEDHYKNTVEDGCWPIRALYAEPQASKPLTEEEFLNLKLPCDIKIGSGKNGAGTTIETLLLRANNIFEGAMLIKRKSLSDDFLSQALNEGDGTYRP